MFGNRNAGRKLGESPLCPPSHNIEAHVIDNRLLHGCSYPFCDIVSLSGREGGQMLGQTGCLEEFDESLFVRERCRLRMGPNPNIGEPASQQPTSGCFRRREMPAPDLFEADQERRTNDPLDVTLRAALSHQLPPRGQNRSQVGEQPVMVADPMERCSGENCVNRMIVVEELRVKGQQICTERTGLSVPTTEDVGVPGPASRPMRRGLRPSRSVPGLSSSSVTRPVPQPASRTTSVPCRSRRGRIAFPQRCWGSAMRS